MPETLDSFFETCKGSVDSFFLDSGAFSIAYKHAYNEKTGQRHFEYYDTPAFWKYVDSYIRFIKKFEGAIDYYANVDAIGNPDISWKVLKYMESKGTHPIPVIHFGASMDILKKHMDAGYTYIGFGGGAKVDSSSYIGWADSAWQYICPSSNKYHPLLKVHGFALTGYNLLTRYPWFSVDSASWIKAAAFGTIYIPRKYHGKFAFYREVAGRRVYDLPPIAVSISSVLDKKGKLQKESQFTDSALAIANFEFQPPAVKRLVYEWLDHIRVPLGKVDKRGDELEFGVISHHKARSKANLAFFEAMAASKVPYNEDTFLIQRPVGFF